VWFTEGPEVSSVYYAESTFGITSEDIKLGGTDVHAKTPFHMDDGYRHEVELSDLKPGVVYAYMCGNADHGWSGVSSFVAPRDTLTPRIAVVG
jgi:hypothetical protein